MVITAPPPPQSKARCVSTAALSKAVRPGRRVQPYAHFVSCRAAGTLEFGATFPEPISRRGCTPSARESRWITRPQNRFPPAGRALKTTPPSCSGRRNSGNDQSSGLSFSGSGAVSSVLGWLWSASRTGRGRRGCLECRPKGPRHIGDILRIFGFLPAAVWADADILGEPRGHPLDHWIPATMLLRYSCSRWSDFRI